MKTTKTVIYNDILKAQEFTEDEYWKEIIYSCSCNKFPKNTRYDGIKRILQVRYETGSRVRTDPITIPTESKKIFDTLMDIFKNILCLRSPSDVEKNKRDIEEHRQKNEVDLNCEWKELPRTMRNHILLDYSIAQGEKYGLIYKETNLIYRTISLGFQFRNLSQDNVVYKNGQIQEIKGLKYNESTRRFVLNNTKTSSSRGDNKNSNKNSKLDKSIDKWAVSYNKNVLTL